MKKKNLKVIFGVLVISIIIMLGTTVKASDDIIVILDPGHGGGESGAVSGGIVEKDVTWKIAKRVKEILDGTQGIQGILARNEWDNPSLYQRGLLAKNAGADLLVSFHINASTSSNPSGAETYITGDTNSPRFYESSKILGESVLANLRNVGVPTRVYRPILKPSTDGERYSDGFISDYYGIIRNPMYYGIPGVLIEHCYITNPHDRINFLNDWKINQMAEADAYAIIANKERFRINREDNNMNSQVMSLGVNQTKTHLSGEIVVVDWINNMQSIPSGVTISLKENEGNISIPCYVERKNGNTYYFDTWLTNIDISKNYNLEVSTGDKVNIPIHHTMNAHLGTDRILGEDTVYNYLIENNTIKSETKEYVGNLNSEIKKLNTLKVNDNLYYLTGEIIAVEWVDGKSTVPRQLPVMRLKSTDGVINKKCYIKHNSGNTYYFDADLISIDTDKEYYLEIASENKYNLSTQKVQKVDLSQLPENVGRYRKDKMIKNNGINLIFDNYTYIGNINSELIKFNVGKAGESTFVSGEIVVVEWVDEKSTVPEEMPKMRFKSTDGIVNIDVFVTPTGTNTYYFDRYIEGIDTSKEYYFEIESGDSKNISLNKSMNVYFSGTKYDNMIVGEYHNKRIRLLQQKIKFEEDTYIGNINSELIKFDVGKAGESTFVSGEIVVVEWVDGKSTVPEKTPKMRFKSTDGIVNIEVFVTPTGTNTYYFDRYIEGIDTSKEYYFEIESGDSKNISPNKSMNVYFSGTKYNDTVVGNYHEYDIRLVEQKIKFE